MQIRKSQTDHFDRTFHEKYVAELAALLRRDYARYVSELSDGDLLELTSEGVDRARSYGLESDDDLATFTKLLFAVSWNFDEYPPFQRILTEPDYDGSERIAYLMGSATAEDWVAAADF